MELKTQQRDITELLDACQKGDLSAQRALYEMYVKAMLNTAFRILNNVEDAEDAVQESFLRAFRRLSGFRAESSFGAWLKRIVVNQSINALNRRRAMLVSLEEDTRKEIEVGKHEADEELPYAAEDALKALHQLPDGYRTVFSLYLLEGYDHQEIADILGISVSTSISQYHRAKKRLRAILKKMKHHGQDRAVV